MSSIEGLIAAGQHAEALRMAKEELKRRPGDHGLLAMCADIYIFMRQEQKAVDVLKHVANSHASAGSPAKAVAALKKIDRMGREDKTMYESLATRIEQGSSEATPTLVLDEFDRLRPVVHTPQTVDIANPEGLRSIEETRVVDDAVPSALFDDFGHDELLAFIKGLELQVFDAGDIIVSEGDRGDSLYILTSGMAKAFIKRDGRQQRVRTLHDGDFFGEISILSGGKRTATITAATACELLELNRATLDAITAAHPRVLQVMEEFRDERVAADRMLGG